MLFRSFFEEGNSWLDLEEHGWSFDDCEMIIDCDMDIEMIEPTDDTPPKEESKGTWPN